MNFPAQGYGVPSKNSLPEGTGPKQSIRRSPPEVDSDRTQPAAVAAAPCETYAPPHVARAVSDLLSALGGTRTILGTAKTVLIKPNMLTDRLPEESVTTHPEVVRPLIREFKAAGATVSVADSPANVTRIERVWDRTGFATLCREENVELVNLEKAGVENVTSGSVTVPVARPILEADLLINVPKVKTHVLTTLTGAVKNLYGAIPGFRKATLHKERHQPRDFAEVVAALYRVLRPGLSIADGIMGMDGEGPSNGTPYPLGILAASTDAVALDMALCGFMGIPIRRVPYLAPLSDVTNISPSEVVWKGTRPESLRKARLPRTPPLHLIPRPLVRAVAPLVWIRPFFGDACKFCGRCVTACPTGALSQKEKTLPVLDRGRCVACCCCHEVCPAKAVTMTASPLLRLFRAGGLP